MISNEKHRKAAILLAKDMGATESQRVLRNPQSSTGQIFKAALAKVGEAELIAKVLGNDPAWAYFALINPPELGETSEPLRQRAAVFEEQAARSSPSLLSRIAVNLERSVDNRRAAPSFDD